MEQKIDDIKFNMILESISKARWVLYCALVNAGIEIDSTTKTEDLVKMAKDILKGKAVK